MCPHCGRDAPIVYRGVLPYCTACGGLRAPLTTASINLAGKPSQVGGTVASVAGWLILLIGLSIGLGAGLMLWAVFTIGVALAVALPIALVSAALGAILLRSGSSMRRSGADAERATRDQALLAMAAHQGPVTAADAARILGVSIPVADAMLTALAKREPERVAVDVDDQGVVRFRAARLAFDGAYAQERPGARLRIDEHPDEARPEAEADAEQGDADQAGRARR
jgi:hypothetical protein